MPLIHSIAASMAEHVDKVREINRRYATSRIQMSLPVRVALLSLRLYLFVLVGLLVFKFISILTQ